jgi:hypothetical protein
MERQRLLNRDLPAMDSMDARSERVERTGHKLCLDPIELVPPVAWIARIRQIYRELGQVCPRLYALGLEIDVSVDDTRLDAVDEIGARARRDDDLEEVS